MDLKSLISDNAIDEIVDFVNSKINLPILNEEQERLLFKLALSAIFQLLGAKALSSAKKTIIET